MYINDRIAIYAKYQTILKRYNDIETAMHKPFHQCMSIYDTTLSKDGIVV